MWFLADIADALEAGLRQAAERLDAEQAIRGLDACDEVELHPVLAEALEAAGYGVFREQRYPSERRKRSASEGERCDFVLTPQGRPLSSGRAQGELFQSGEEVDVDIAFWLEVKVVHQFLLEGPNANYASQLLSTVRRDVTKLARDEGILHAGVLIVLFVREAEIAGHDLRIWQDKCLERGLPISAPYVRHVPLRDRHGHACCSLALYGVSHI